MLNRLSLFIVFIVFICLFCFLLVIFLLLLVLLSLLLLFLSIALDCPVQKLDNFLQRKCFFVELLAFFKIPLYHFHEIGVWLQLHFQLFLTTLKHILEEGLYLFQRNFFLLAFRVYHFPPFDDVFVISGKNLPTLLIMLCHFLLVVNFSFLSCIFA